MKQILIVEDDKSIAELERDYLEAADFQVTIAADGRQGLNLAQSEEYDLLLLDIMLPGVDGFPPVHKRTPPAVRCHRPRGRPP